MEKIGKFAEGDSTAHADIECEYSAVRDGGRYRAEYTVSVGGEVYRAEEWGTTLHEAIDLAGHELFRELRRAKRKRLHMVRRGALQVKDFIRGLRDRI